MNRKKLLLTIAIVSGLLIGVSASPKVGEDRESKCEKVEEAMIEASNFSGAVACFPPGVLDVDLNDVVENKTTTECVCRRSFEGTVKYSSINKAD
jgi:hypothetical protein